MHDERGDCDRKLVFAVADVGFPVAKPDERAAGFQDREDDLVSNEVELRYKAAKLFSRAGKLRSKASNLLDRARTLP